MKRGLCCLTQRVIFVRFTPIRDSLKSKHTNNVLPVRVINGNREVRGNQAAARRATGRFAGDLQQTL